ncbi:MAG: TRAP transporter large permease subunit, partial [Proteobacteria bacterium]|nr:TRAP transporter large permease subunit [Pseudomonadota bacterium]
ESVYGTAHATGMIFMVLIGADLLNSSLALSQMPTELATWVQQSGMPAMLVLAAIIVIYIVLGCVMDSLAMILLTIPIFYPMVMGLDFFGMPVEDKSIWFGILALMVVEIGLVTPPMGMNLYVVNKQAKEVPMKETIAGVLPFLASDLIRIVALVFFPVMCLGLVHWLG